MNLHRKTVQVRDREITVCLSDNKKYEEFKLQWMIDQGYTLEDIFKELDEIYEDWIDHDGKAPKPSILFDEFELDYGFNETLYPSFDEWFRNDYERK